MKLSLMNSWQLICLNLHHVEFTWELPLSSTRCVSSYRIKDCWTMTNPLAMKPIPPPGKTDVLSPVTKTIDKYKTPGRWYWFHLQRICHCLNPWPFNNDIFTMTFHIWNLWKCSQIRFTNCALCKEPEQQNISKNKEGGLWPLPRFFWWIRHSAQRSTESDNGPPKVIIFPLKGDHLPSLS